MYQIDVATAATALPTPATPGTEGFFTDGNPASGLPATIVDADFMNMLMMELINLVEAGGQSPSKTTYNQVLTAIKALGQQSAGNVGTDTGAANAYVVAFTPALTAPVPWVPFWFKVKTTNTGASTLNAAGTAEPLLGGAHLALQGGEMVAGGNALVYWNPTLNSGSGSYVLMFCSGAPDQVAAGTQSNHAAQIGQVQTGGLNYAVAGGTSDALTATLPAGVSALTDGFPLRLKLGAANTTTTPTLNVTIGTTATGALTIVKGADAALVAGDLVGAGGEADFTYNASNTTWVLKNPATGVSASSPQVQTVGASVASNALTMTYTPVGSLAWRNPTLTNGAPVSMPASAIGSQSITVPSGASLGTVASQQSQLVLLEAYNAGSPVLCVANLAGGLDLSETNLISPITISSGSTSAAVIYSASAVAANSPYRVVGVITMPGQTTAGTWATDHTAAQGAGGMAYAAMQSLGVGQTWQNVTASRAANTAYYNTTGRPIAVSGSLATASGGAWVVNGVSTGTFSGSTSVYVTGFAIVPPGASYQLNTAGSIVVWAEMR